MAELFSQYASGVQFGAGPIVGSATGASGLNPIVDRLNSISTYNNLITGSVISGTSTSIITPYQNNSNWNGDISGTSTNIVTSYQDNNLWNGSMVSGTSLSVYASGGNLLNRNLSNISRTAYGSSIGTSTYSIIGGSSVITTTGGPVFVITRMSNIAGSSSSNQTISTRLQRDSSATNTGVVELFKSFAPSTFFSMYDFWIDVPSAGTHSYYLTAYQDGLIGSMNTMSISAIELRN